MVEAASALLALGQQVMQQQSGDQPTVCFAMVPLLIPAALIVAHRVGRHLRRLSARPA